MVERWKKAGQTQSSKKCRFGLDSWSGIVGGILEANGYANFLEGNDEEDDDISEQLHELALDYIGSWMTAKTWLSFAQQRNLFKLELNSQTLRGQETQMGKLLNGLVGRKIKNVEHGDKPVTIELKVIDRGDRREYAFVEVQVQAEPKKGNTEVQTKKIKTGKGVRRAA